MRGVVDYTRRTSLPGASDRQVKAICDGIRWTSKNPPASPRDASRV